MNPTADQLRAAFAEPMRPWEGLGEDPDDPDYRVGTYRKQLTSWSREALEEARNPGPAEVVEKIYLSWDRKLIEHKVCSLSLIACSIMPGRADSYTATPALRSGTSMPRRSTFSSGSTITCLRARSMGAS